MSKKYYLHPSVNGWAALRVHGQHLENIPGCDAVGFVLAYTNKAKFKKEWPRTEPIVMEQVEEDDE